MYIGLNEAKDCNYGMLEIQNKLGLGRVLNVTCNNSPSRPENMLKFNEKRIYLKRESVLRPWICIVFQTPKTDYSGRVY